MTSSAAVLVTGVAHGIGRAIAERLVRDGYQVLGVDIVHAGPPGLAAFEQADMADASAARSALARLAASFPITRLVNNVGSSEREYLSDSTGETQRRLIRLNLCSALLCAQAVLPTMRRARFGRIVNITSRAVYGRDTRSAYSATKSGLAALTRSWAIELAPDGITVNAVGPGMIDTELFRRNNPPQAPDVARLRNGIPMRRLGHPSEVANAVAFFLDEGASYVTGQSIFVCGGLSLGAHPVADAAPPASPTGSPESIAQRRPPTAPREMARRANLGTQSRHDPQPEETTDVSGSPNLPRIDGEEILAGIREWVEIETPSGDGAAVNRLVDLVERALRDVGQEIERTPGRDGYGDTLIGRSPWGRGEKGILVVAHLDTVHPRGSLAGPMPWRREGDVVFAPGVYDMKAGAHMAFYAYRHLVRLGRSTPLPITLLFVPEEEIGSPTSRSIIEREARRAKYALVVEPARDGGKVVLGRKGWARFVVRATGRAAHAGGRHQDGRSAIKEMARQILALEAMTDYETGITVNVGTVVGGTGTNVVPAHCEITVDMRLPSRDLVETCIARVLSLRSGDPDVTVAVEGGLNRPPYEPDDGTRGLFEHARTLAGEIGFELEGVRSGGVSDGNFVAALGVPTLDGLGADGRGAHAPDEQIYVSSLVPRTRLLLRLFETLS